MSDIVFYTNPMSRGRIVRWMLEEVGAPYNTVVLDYGPPMKSPEYLAINPMGKVPAIVHKGQVVTECAAICAYLADAFPKAGLAPAVTSPERGPYYRWMFMAAGPLETAVVNRSFGFEVPDDPQSRARAGWIELDAMADMLADLLSDGRDWLLGPDFSALDVFLGSQIAWGRQFGTVPDRKGFDGYIGRIMSRPAARRAQELDDAAGK
ncbi:glutathione S-transferase family protein [Tropicibacter oceani]|uniref:Glutathione S-transferase family protein n=1 Tax=Tropicibacter oceani TaxID=3058420 RepID=A0ABY8QK17_9RHOB|nr:glutathione S-transferase family protein [Tropicibacter oceani]WGW04970.1 glutathione S-transferase family protein [Tropicibacter oceani]